MWQTDPGVTLALNSPLAAHATVSTSYAETDVVDEDGEGLCSDGIHYPLNIHTETRYSAPSSAAEVGHINIDGDSNYASIHATGPRYSVPAGGAEYTPVSYIKTITYSGPGWCNAPPPTKNESGASNSPMDGTLLWLGEPPDCLAIIANNSGGCTIAGTPVQNNAYSGTSPTDGQSEKRVWSRRATYIIIK
jgi:hypothetical protein